MHVPHRGDIVAERGRSDGECMSFIVVISLYEGSIVMVGSPVKRFGSGTQVYVGIRRCLLVG